MDGQDKIRVNPGYALDQLVRALESDSPNAARRAAQWKQVISGLFSGKLRIGSRTPIADTPPWVTLEVIHGGFVTGALAAAGPLLEHEQARLQRIEGPLDASERALLNGYFITDEGRQDLAEMLAATTYRVDVPEEAALPVVQWLIERGETRRANELLRVIAPFWDRLRFYPSPTTQPRRTTDALFVRSAPDVVAALRAKRPQAQVRAMKEAINIWTPLYDRAASLFLETVRGDMPRFAQASDGSFKRRHDGQPVAEGGWPCAVFADDWAIRAQQLLDDYELARSSHSLSGKPNKPKENFPLLRGYLSRCIDNRGSLTGRDVGMIRKILASYVTKHGAPGSVEHDAKRSLQTQNASQPEHVDLARVLADRIDRHDATDGLPELMAELGPLSAGEAADIGAAEGRTMPPYLVAKAARCLEAPLETLLEVGVVGSSEVLAELLPPLTAKVRAGVIESPDLRRIYEDSYVAFRRRRSLLLLDLESQVRLEELPWLKAIQPWIGSDGDTQKAARAALVRATQAALRWFPQTILPNKLVRELRALSHTAGARLQLVDELAADIFMGTFSASFLRAAHQAMPQIAGTVYEHYYGLPIARVAALDDVRKESKWAAPTSAGFAAICHELAGVDRTGGWSVARNGMVIEQAQILTTHNIAQLVGGLAINGDVPLTDLARACFTWICNVQQRGVRDWRAQMQAVKNTAYAWRQMLLYLSFDGPESVTEFVPWADDHLGQQRVEFQERFRPAFLGLQLVAGGGRFDADGTHDSGARRLLGWSVGGHWLLPLDSGE